MLNYRFPSVDEFPAISTTGRADVGPHVHVSLEPERGRIRLETDELFRLIFEPSAVAPRWSEMGIALTDRGWLDCHSIHVKYRASARKPARVQAALRLHRPEGFHDHFAPLPNEIGSSPEHVSADFTLSPRLLERVESCDLYLFFDNAANVLDLHGLVVTGFR